MKIVVCWRGRRAAFSYPVEPVRRTALLESWFAAPERGSGVRAFPVDARGNVDEQALERFEPQALAGSWERLVRVALTSRVRPTHAVVVLHRDRGPLTATEREALWRGFRAPVFEQMIGPRGVLLASECAAHAGMHIMLEPGLADRDWNGRIERAPCGCGKTSPRLVAGEIVETPRSLAAQAR